MRNDFDANAGKFRLSGTYEGHPHWHALEANGKTVLRLLRPDDLLDLQYLINRAVEHHKTYGSK